MGDHYEVLPLRPESRTAKVQSKYFSRKQLENVENRDFMKNIAKNPEKKLEKCQS